MEPSSPLVTNDAVVCGIIVGVIGLVFYTSGIEHPFWRRFYAVCPRLMLCYFLPAILGTVGVFSAEESQLYFVASRYFLPASLVLLTLPTNLREIARLGPKALLVFGAATTGVIIGGPVALWTAKVLMPDFMSEYDLVEVAAAMSTLAGSWIGGGANQAAMKEIFNVGGDIFAVVVTVDVLVASILLMLLILGASHTRRIDKWLGVRQSDIEKVQAQMKALRPTSKAPISTASILILSAIGLGAMALGHTAGDKIAAVLSTYFPTLKQHSLTSSFFWLVVIATTAGLLLSLTPLRKLESKGASELGSALLYFLVATIGMSMDLTAIFRHAEMFLVGMLWISVHVAILLMVARALRAPFFFVAVGSQANIGGAASAPVVAAAFHPALAPVGVLLAVLGYALGTYGAYVCGLWMQWIAT